MVGEAIGKLIVDKVKGMLPALKEGTNAVDGATSTSTSSGGFGSMPNTDEHVGVADSEVAGAQSDLRQNNEVAQQRTTDIRNEGWNTAPTDIYDEANRDFAESDKGDKNLNRRSFGQTLNLSRQADAYNSMPKMNVIRTTNGQGGMTSIDTGLEKPKIETQEMRQMRANERLSERQRQLRQNIQNLVERKNYDLFVAWYQQKFGLNLSLTQAEQSVITFNRTQQISNQISMHRQLFTEQLRMFVSTQIANYITSKAAAGDFLWSTYFLGAYGLSVRPGQLMDYYEEQWDKELQDLAKKNKTDYLQLREAVTNAKNSIRRTITSSSMLD